MRLPVARDGFSWIFGCALGAAAATAVHPIGGALCWGLTLFVISFFRDPERQITQSDSTVLSPADGTITQIKPVNWDGDEYQHIVIFLSVFNVHINRVPYSGKVTKLDYKKGAFKAAFDPNIDKKNERMEITFDTPKGKMKMVQIAGLLARRIVCRLTEGQAITQGDRFGLIKFSSRTDLYLPKSATISVKKGQKVLGGTSVLATFD